jgi:hypothetical protein
MRPAYFNAESKLMLLQLDAQADNTRPTDRGLIWDATLSQASRPWNRPRTSTLL